MLVVEVTDRPNGLGGLTREFAAANVNVAYTRFDGVKIVIATDDRQRARCTRVTREIGRGA